VNYNPALPHSKSIILLFSPSSVSPHRIDGLHPPSPNSTRVDVQCVPFRIPFVPRVYKKKEELNNESF
jgi:hypothetical protein